jgi:hypothetical protein
MLYGHGARAGIPWRDKGQATRLANRCRLLPGALTLGGITPLLLIYVLFFFSQTAYFLSAFRGILPPDLTYAEYARRGFFELCAISGINLVVIGLLGLFTRRAGAGDRWQKVYGVTLAIFSLALAGIALRKMLMYVQMYGLTPKRLSASWFMLFLLLVFALVIVRALRPGLNLVKWAVTAGGVMLLVFCLVNTDGLVADYNIAGYRDGRLKSLDLDFFWDLGDRATPRLLAVLLDEGMDDDHREYARRGLGARIRGYQHAGIWPGTPERGDWRRWTWAEYRAARLLWEYEALIFGAPDGG